MLGVPEFEQREQVRPRPKKKKKLEYASSAMMHGTVSHKRSTFINTRAFNEAAAAAIFPLILFLKKRAKKWGNEEVGPHKKGTFPPFSTCCYLLHPLLLCVTGMLPPSLFCIFLFFSMTIFWDLGNFASKGETYECVQVGKRK